MKRQSLPSDFSSGTMTDGIFSSEDLTQDESLDNCTEPHGQPTMLCRAVFIGLGLLLLVAAGFKSYQAYSEPMSTWRFVEVLAVICFEVCFGTWLVVGARTAWTWRASVACFATFACISAYKASTGASSCGCFGTLQVDPRITLGIDVTAIVLLMYCRTSVEAMTESTMRRVFPRVASTALALSLLATVVPVVGHYRFVQSDGSETTTGQLVLLEPDSWIGVRWPLLTLSSLEDDLAVGEWGVLLFRHDCHVCHDVMLELEQQLSLQTIDHRIALIGIDQKAEDERVGRLQQLGCLLGYLPQDREWFATTPVRLHLNNGVCVSAEVIERWD